MEATPSFILGEALSVVLAKLAKQILRGSALTWQNSLKKIWRHREKRLASIEGSGGLSRNMHRSIPDLLTIATVCLQQSENFREMWVYEATIIGEVK